MLVKYIDHGRSLNEFILINDSFERLGDANYECKETHTCCMPAKY